MEESGFTFRTERTGLRILLKTVIQLSELWVLCSIIRVHFKESNYKDTLYVILVKYCINFLNIVQYPFQNNQNHRTNYLFLLPKKHCRNRVVYLNVNISARVLAFIFVF